MSRVLWYQLISVYYIQGGITIIAVCISKAVSIPMTPVLTLGVYTIYSMYLSIILLYYFTDYIAANISTLVCLGVVVLCSYIACKINAAFELPLLLGGLFGWATAILFLKRRMKNLTEFLLC